MRRYTALNTGNTPYNKNEYPYLAGDINKVVDKLGKLEDLEEEMNVPLDKVINALFKNGIYVYDAGEVVHLEVTDISLHYNKCMWLWETTYGAKPFRNYKNTWWFSKEEVEE